MYRDNRPELGEKNNPRQHPWNVLEFEKDRKEQFDCAVEITKALDYNSNVLVKAPVKSGKRQIAEIVALTYAQKDVQNRHYFITALNRLDTKEQIEELKQYKLEVIVLASSKDSRNLLQKLKQTENPNNAIIHFDESDYGTGIKNLFSKIFEICKERKIKLVCYSATNEEAENSDFGKVAKIIELKPNPLYKGASWFLENDLVFEPHSFFDGSDLTEHGKEVINWWLTLQDKPIGILRLTGGEKDVGLYNAFRKSKVQARLSQQNIKILAVDAYNGFDWMDQYKDLVSDFQEFKNRTLLVVNQTCTRSTELGFHQYLAFLHDHRPGEPNYGTLAQAYLRVAHYHQKGHKIRVYANKEVFELAAGRISYKDYNGKLGARISKQVTNAGGALAQGPEHWFTPEETINIKGMSLEEQEKKIREIWNKQIQIAQKDFSYKGKSEVDKRLSFKKDETKQRWFPFENEALGGKTTTTTKRHVFTYKNDTEIVVGSIFHDGKKEEKKESTSHFTSEKSIYQS